MIDPLRTRGRPTMSISIPLLIDPDPRTTIPYVSSPAPFLKIRCFLRYASHALSRKPRYMVRYPPSFRTSIDVLALLEQ